MKRTLPLVALSLIVVLGACRSGSRRSESSRALPPAETQASTPTDVEAPAPAPTESADAPPVAAAPAEGEADYVFGLLRTGPASGTLSVEERRTLGTGHLENIGRLASERKLVAAGPFRSGSPRPELRGVFVMNVPDVERARALVATDPAVAAGAFEVDLYPWRSTAALQQVLEIDLAAEAERRASNPGAPPTFELGEYMLVEARAIGDVESALASLREDGTLLFFGRVNDDPTARVFFVLNLKTAEEARAALAPAAAALSDLALHPWAASASLKQLPELEAGD